MPLANVPGADGDALVMEADQAAISSWSAVCWTSKAVVIGVQASRPPLPELEDVEQVHLSPVADVNLV